MSTRSNIAIEDEKGKIHAIYVHSDGYPNGVGHCLLTYYNDYKKAKLSVSWIVKYMALLILYQLISH